MTIMPGLCDASFVVACASAVPSSPLALGGIKQKPIHPRIAEKGPTVTCVPARAGAYIAMDCPQMRDRIRCLNRPQISRISVEIGVSTHLPNSMEFGPRVPQSWRTLVTSAPSVGSSSTKFDQIRDRPTLGHDFGQVLGQTRPSLAQHWPDVDPIWPAFDRTCPNSTMRGPAPANSSPKSDQVRPNFARNPPAFARNRPTSARLRSKLARFRPE